MAYINSRLWRRLLIWAAIAAAVYFGNVQVQTWLGERARVATGLESCSLDEGLARAAASDRLVLADLSAVWCSSCRAFDRRVLADPGVQRVLEEKFVFVRVEYESDEGKAFRERYSVRGFPRILVLDAQGTLVRVLPAVDDPATFVTALHAF